MIFKISLKVINIFAIRVSVGVSNLTIYMEYVFGNFLHSCIFNCVELKRISEEKIISKNFRQMNILFKDFLTTKQFSIQILSGSLMILDSKTRLNKSKQIK